MQCTDTLHGARVSHKLTDRVHFWMKAGMARLLHCSKQREIAVEIFTGYTPVVMRIQLLYTLLPEACFLL